MGFRFRKSINLGNGFRVNLSKSGLGYSWGTKGVRFTKTASGKSRTTLSVPGTGVSYTSSSGGTHHGSTNHSTVSTPSANTSKSSSSCWISFVICFFFGLLGVHKFIEGKIGKGLLYLFTFGLCGFGWLWDSANYLIAAIKSTSSNGSNASASVHNQSPQPTDPEGSDNDPQKQEHRNIWLWLLTAFFVVLFCGNFPKFSAFLALGGAVLVIPIPKWQEVLSQFVKGKLKTVAVVALAILACAAFPKQGVDISAELPTDAIPVEQISSDSGSAEENPSEPVATQEHAHFFIEATCAAPKTCSICEITEGEALEHTWQAATCQAPETCSGCGETTGEIADHTWQAATCQAPETCSGCGETTGEIADHTWQAATCTTPETCSTCGETNGSAQSHSYSSGSCYICGAANPNYVPDTMVWIPNSGSKYHSYSSCSNMKNPSQVTESTAIAWGYGPCKRCH